jgi:hypothetical protein
MSSAAQVGASSLPEAGRPLRSWKPARARRTFEPKAPSISPGEKCARSSSTWARSTAGPLPDSTTVSVAALTVSGVSAALETGALAGFVVAGAAGP